MRKDLWFSRSGFAVFLLICALGTYWAFARGGNDFNVFYSAWNLVLHGNGTRIYQAAADRYLYAPGFAWLFSPLGLLPRNLSLLVWCLLKTAVLAATIRVIARKLWPELSSSTAWGIGSWATLFVARPLLIDFQYGQVNGLIVAACVFALFSEKFWAWFWFALAGVSKIYPLSLAALLVRPAFAKQRKGFVLGFILMVVAPAVSVGLGGVITIHEVWKQALIDRGFPTEAHNQSFAAFLDHYFTGKPFQVLSEGPPPVQTGVAIFSAHGLLIAATLWVVLSCAFILYWLLSPNALRGGKAAWVGIACAILILPSHLIWKPYFVLSLPLSIVALKLFKNAGTGFRIACALFIFGMNFSGFDFLGHYWGARLEAASLMFFLNLLLVAMVYRESRKNLVT